jgi:hypothetical protein
MAASSTRDESRQSRRDFLLTARAATAGLVLAPGLLPLGSGLLAAQANASPKSVAP